MDSSTLTSNTNLLVTSSSEAAATGLGTVTAVTGMQPHVQSVNSDSGPGCESGPIHHNIVIAPGPQTQIQFYHPQNPNPMNPNAANHRGQQYQQVQHRSSSQKRAFFRKTRAAGFNNARENLEQQQLQQGPSPQESPNNLNYNTNTNGNIDQNQMNFNQQQLQNQMQNHGQNLNLATVQGTVTNSSNNFNTVTVSGPGLSMINHSDMINQDSCTVIVENGSMQVMNAQAGQCAVPQVLATSTTNENQQPIFPQNQMQNQSHQGDCQNLDQNLLCQQNIAFDNHTQKNDVGSNFNNNIAIIDQPGLNFGPNTQISNQYNKFNNFSKTGHGIGSSSTIAGTNSNHVSSSQLSTIGGSIGSFDGTVGVGGSAESLESVASLQNQQQQQNHLNGNQNQNQIQNFNSIHNLNQNINVNGSNSMNQGYYNNINFESIPNMNNYSNSQQTYNQCHSDQNFNQFQVSGPQSYNNQQVLQSQNHSNVDFDYYNQHFHGQNTNNSYGLAYEILSSNMQQQNRIDRTGSQHRLAASELRDSSMTLTTPNQKSASLNKSSLSRRSRESLKSKSQSTVKSMNSLKSQPQRQSTDDSTVLRRNHSSTKTITKGQVQGQGNAQQLGSSKVQNSNSNTDSSDISVSDIQGRLSSDSSQPQMERHSPQDSDSNHSQTIVDTNRLSPSESEKFESQTQSRDYLNENIQITNLNNIISIDNLNHSAETNMTGQTNQSHDISNAAVTEDCNYSTSGKNSCQINQNNNINLNCSNLNIDEQVDTLFRSNQGADQISISLSGRELPMQNSNASNSLSSKSKTQVPGPGSDCLNTMTNNRDPNTIDTVTVPDASNCSSSLETSISNPSNPILVRIENRSSIRRSLSLSNSSNQQNSNNNYNQHQNKNLLTNAMSSPVSSLHNHNHNGSTNLNNSLNGSFTMLNLSKNRLSCSISPNSGLSDESILVDRSSNQNLNQNLKGIISNSHSASGAVSDLNGNYIQSDKVGPDLARDSLNASSLLDQAQNIQRNYRIHSSNSNASDKSDSESEISEDEFLDDDENRAITNDDIQDETHPLNGPQQFNSENSESVQSSSIRKYRVPGEYNACSQTQSSTDLPQSTSTKSTTTTSTSTSLDAHVLAQSSVKLYSGRKLSDRQNAKRISKIIHNQASDSQDAVTINMLNTGQESNGDVAQNTMPCTSPNSAEKCRSSDSTHNNNALDCCFRFFKITNPKKLLFFQIGRICCSVFVAASAVLAVVLMFLFLVHFMQPGNILSTQESDEYKKQQDSSIVVPMDMILRPKPREIIYRSDSDSDSESDDDSSGANFEPPSVRPGFLRRGSNYMGRVFNLGARPHNTNYNFMGNHEWHITSLEDLENFIFNRRNVQRATTAAATGTAYYSTKNHGGSSSNSRSKSEGESGNLRGSSGINKDIDADDIDHDGNADSDNRSEDHTDPDQAESHDPNDQDPQTDTDERPLNQNNNVNKQGHQTHIKQQPITQRIRLSLGEYLTAGTSINFDIPALATGFVKKTASLPMSIARSIKGMIISNNSQELDDGDSENLNSDANGNVGTESVNDIASDLDPNDITDHHHHLNQDSTAVPSQRLCSAVCPECISQVISESHQNMNSNNPNLHIANLSPSSLEQLICEADSISIPNSDVHGTPQWDALADHLRETQTQEDLNNIASEVTGIISNQNTVPPQIGPLTSPPNAATPAGYRRFLLSAYSRCLLSAHHHLIYPNNLNQIISHYTQYYTHWQALKEFIMSHVNSDGNAAMIASAVAVFQGQFGQGVFEFFKVAELLGNGTIHGIGGVLGI